MKISLLILSPPDSASALVALNYAKAVIRKQHQLYRIFFYHQGAYHGNQLNTPPQDEINIGQDWSAFIRQEQLDAVVCIAAGLKRGIINAAEQQRFNKASANLDGAFDLSGLGQLIDAQKNSDRLITFGA